MRIFIPPFIGPKSREILSMITSFDLSNENMPPNSAAVVKIKGHKGNDEFTVRVLRVSFVGELGYELHIPKETCAQVYNILMKAGESFNLRNAGYRSLYSLSSEKGYDRKKKLIEFTIINQTNSSFCSLFFYALFV